MAREIISWTEWAGLWPEQAANKNMPAARVFQEVRTGPAAGYAEAVNGWGYANGQTLLDGRLYHAPHGPGAGGAIIWQTNLLGEVVAGIYYAPDGPYIAQPTTIYENPAAPTPALWAENLDEVWTFDLEGKTFARAARAASGNEFDGLRGLAVHPGGKTVYLFNAELEVRTLTAAGWSAALTLDAGQYYCLTVLENGLVGTIRLSGVADCHLVLIDVSGTTPAVDSVVDLTAAVVVGDISTLGAIGDDVLVSPNDGTAKLLRIGQDGTVTWTRNISVALFAEFATAYTWSGVVTDHSFAIGGSETSSMRYGISPPAVNTLGRIACVVSCADGFGQPDECYFLVVLDGEGTVVEMTPLPNRAYVGGENVSYWQVTALGARFAVWDGVDTVIVYDGSGVYEAWWTPFDVAVFSQASDNIAPATDDDWYDVTIPTTILGFAYAAALFGVPGTDTIHLLETWGALKGHSGVWLSWNADGSGEDSVALTDAPVFNAISGDLDATSDPTSTAAAVANLSLSGTITGGGTGFPPG